MNKEPLKILENLWAVALSVTMAFIAILQGKDKFEQLFYTDLLHFILTIALLIVTLIEFLIYMWVTRRELKMIRDYLENENAPRFKGNIFFIIIGIATAFGVLISFTHNIFIFCIAIIVLNHIDLIGEWTVLKTIKGLISTTMKNGVKKENEKKTILTMNRFYFDNPTILRDILIMSGNWIGLCFAIVYLINNQTEYRTISYIIIILNQIVGETVLKIWRSKRDNLIDQYESNNDV